MKLKSRKTGLVVLVAVLGLSLAGGAGYFYYQYQNAQKEILGIKTDPNAAQKAAQEDVQKLITDVGKLIDLPQGETPTVATVSDVEKLKGQPFFQNAKNGDRVLIFAQSKKAYLYDPNVRKLIEVAPLNIASPSAQVITLNSVVLMNGTNISGLTAKYENVLKKSYPAVTVGAKENASKNDYEKSILVPLSDGVKPSTDAIAKTLDLTVSDLPAGEIKPEKADFLIILGKDKAN